MTPGIGDEIQPPNLGDDDRSKLEKLQDKLYSSSEFIGQKGRKKLESQEYETTSDWDDPDLDEVIKDGSNQKTFNVFPILVIISFIFFVGAVGYGAYKFFSGGQLISGNDVDITVIGPVSVGGGEELALDIVVQNNNQSPIETVDLVIEYPDGTKQASDLRTDLPRLREGLGDIAPNSVVKKTHVAALFGEEGTSKEIKVKVEYRLPGSNAIFEREKLFDVILQSSPIRLTIDTVKEITSNQELEFDVSLVSNSNQTLENVLVKADYPFGFVFESADIQPVDGSDTWYFENLRPNEKQEFTVKGRLQGQSSEERVFRFDAGIADESNQNEMGIAFTSIPKSVTISQPFFAVSMDFAGDTGQLVIQEGNESIDVNVDYVNNTDTIIRDAVIEIKFDGDVLNEGSVSLTEGFYRSRDNTIIWDKGTAPKLAEIEPGEDGTFKFNFRTKPLASESAVFQNPEIVVSVNTKGIRVSETQVTEELESSFFRRVRFLSDVQIDAQTVYYTGPFTNNGPIPPKVDTPTTYTVTLSLTNSSNDIENGRVVARLPNYVEWLNIATPVTETINYDPITRHIEWKLGDIAPSSGFGTGEREVSFQVQVIPSVSQVGSNPRIVESIVFTGLDAFVERNIEEVTNDATTNIPGLDNVSSDRVVE